jgi:hypothetical protein
VSSLWGRVCPIGSVPFVAFTEPSVPLVDVFGSGREENLPDPLQEIARAMEMIATYKSCIFGFILQLFKTIPMKKSRHGLNRRKGDYSAILLNFKNGSALTVISIV